MGTISQIYSDESPAVGLSPDHHSPSSLFFLFLFLTLCRSLRLSGTLRKIGYLYLCLAFPQTQSPSILSSPPPLSLSLSISLPLSSSVGLLERSALNPEWLLCSINEGKAENPKLTLTRGGKRAGVETLKTETERWIGGREGKGRREERGRAVCWKPNFSPCSLSLLCFVPQTHPNWTASLTTGLN